MNEILEYIHSTPFKLESEATIENLKIGYNTYGELNHKKNNVIWVFHALTANSDVFDWWKGLFGEDDLFNPKDNFIVCANVLGSPYGSTKPEDRKFPQFTVRDVVNAHLILANKLGIEKIHTAIGGSFGGYQALEFAYSFKGKIDHLVLIATSAKESAWGIAVHEAQRVALKSDPTFGEKSGGLNGMKAARAQALLTYRTVDAYIGTQTDDDDKLDDFKASSYVQYQGDKFVARFESLSYYYLTKCLDSHSIGRNRGGEINALSSIKIPTLIIGIDSDKLIPTQFQKKLNQYIPNSIYKVISSSFGHDGFLVETEALTNLIRPFISNNDNQFAGRTILKFGGSSLGSESNLKNTIEIIKKTHANYSTAVVVSAIGKSTDILTDIYHRIISGQPYLPQLALFLNLQKQADKYLNLKHLEHELKSFLDALNIICVDDKFAFNKLLSYGEVFSAQIINSLLSNEGLNCEFVDARKIIVLQEDGNLHKDSIKLTKEYFSNVDDKVIPIITGFIARDEKYRTVTLGRNGSNYSATLIASFINAQEVQNWTNVSGIYSANPKYINNATKIDRLSYSEAHELANFGANILHGQTIGPLIEKNIPLKILNTENPNDSGTIITKEKKGKGMKAVSIVEDVALICIIGSGLLGKIGIDARIFTALAKEEISVRLISQASSERGIGFITEKDDAVHAERVLLKEFDKEILKGEISSISSETDKAIIAIIGRHNYALEKAIKGLRKNKIWMHLISNSITGEHISLVVDSKDVKKAVTVVYNHVFDKIKTLNVFCFGKGNVGRKFIQQINKTKKILEKERNLGVKLIGVADSRSAIVDANIFDNNDWQISLKGSNLSNDPDHIISLLRNSEFENIVIVDNTASNTIASFYPQFVKNGFDIIASNKVANIRPFSEYLTLRKELIFSGRKFLYETNVGAGLPIIDTLNNLRYSSDTVLKVRGVFSGSLSYIFNEFSKRHDPFSTILLEARAKGYTEPDARDDLSGNDVARKLIILARELGSKAEMSDVIIQNLVPKTLRAIGSFDDFIIQKKALNEHYEAIKSSLKTNEVLRYTGELDFTCNTLKVSLVNVDRDSILGRIKDADAIFEIYTKTYGEKPLIIQGAGAGSDVTAQGVYSDLIRLGQST